MSREPGAGEALTVVRGLSRRAVSAVLAACAARLAELDGERSAEPDHVRALPPPSVPLAPEEERLLTPGEVARLLGVDVATVARLRIPGRRKLGHRTYRYPRAAVLAYAASKT